MTLRVNTCSLINGFLEVSKARHHILGTEMMSYQIIDISCVPNICISPRHQFDAVRQIKRGWSRMIIYQHPMFLEMFVNPLHGLMTPSWSLFKWTTCVVNSFKHRHTHFITPVITDPQKCLSSRESGAARSTSWPESNIHQRFRVLELRFATRLHVVSVSPQREWPLTLQIPHIWLCFPIADHPHRVPPSVRKPGSKNSFRRGNRNSWVFQARRVPFPTFTRVRSTSSPWRRTRAGCSITGSLSGFSLGHNLRAELWWSHIVAIYKEGQLTNCIVYQPIENTSQSHSHVLSRCHLLAFTQVVKMSSCKPK